MAQRIAAISSIVVFAACLMVGAVGAENTFATSVGRALLAMMATLVVGLIVGSMAQRMISENVAGVIKPPDIKPMDTKPLVMADQTVSAKPQAGAQATGRKK